MKYNFDKIIDRKHTSCAKWDLTDMKFSRKGLLPFWIADMDFEAPKPVIDSLVKRAQHGIFGYTVIDDDYYEQVANWRKKRFGCEIEKDWIVYAPSVLVGLISAVEAFTNTKEKIILQTPVYAAFAEKISNISRDILTNPLKNINGRYEIDFEDLEEKAKDPLAGMLVLCNPHNPVGRVFTKEELKKIGDICNRNSVLVFADEIHSDLVFSNNKHIAYESISAEFAQNSIIATAVGKTFNISGLNMANMIIPNNKIRERFKLYLTTKLNFHLMLPFGQEAVKAGYEFGEEWLEQVIEYIHKNMQFMDKYFKERIPKIKLIKPEGTYLAWIDFRELGLSGSELQKWFVDELNLGIYEGSIFGKEGEGFARINVACPRYLVEKCLTIIENGVKQLSI